MSDQLEAWDNLTAEDISQKDFDSVVEQYVEVRKQKEAIKKELKPVEEKLQKLEAKIVAMLEATNKERYHVSGVGLVYKATRKSVKTPKDVESKQQLFDYIKSKYGEDTLMDYLTVNSARLNSFFKQEDELAAQDGKGDFSLPGVGQPVSYTGLRFNKD